MNSSLNLEKLDILKKSRVRLEAKSATWIGEEFWKFEWCKNDCNWSHSFSIINMNSFSSENKINKYILNINKLELKKNIEHLPEGCKSIANFNLVVMVLRTSMRRTNSELFEHSFK